ncbi:hypothetical protein RFX64_02975 [Streptococcus mutans]|uniref:hypothetical protein n=1 Tax=Streptococcus mutans TaxID=1309 RepID=UPI00298AA036|nr:hypothetical protein [Streptococcus mutans]MDW5556608.1 hypothetical protein [Streptococcus mutans]
MTQLELAEKMRVTDKAVSNRKETYLFQILILFPIKGIGTAMGIAVVVLSVLGRLDIKSALMMLGIGAASVSIVLLKGKKEEK